MNKEQESPALQELKEFFRQPPIRFLEEVWGYEKHERKARLQYREGEEWIDVPIEKVWVKAPPHETVCD